MNGEHEQEAIDERPEAPQAPQDESRDAPQRPPEFGGPKGPEPTRYGDWERAGRCIDF